jgi:hypothetical protein
MRENKYRVIFETFPAVPVQMFTPRNSWAFSATKNFPKVPHALKMSFIDPDSDWQAVDRIVYNDGYDITNADYFENITLPLCARSEQAWRDGRYYIAQGKLRPETFSITADIENLICERGDLVTVQYDVARAGGVPVRIKSISGHKVTLTDSVSWNSTDTFYLRMRYQDGRQEEIRVIAQGEIHPGQVDHNSIILRYAPTDALDGDLCVFGMDNFIVDEFLVKSVVPASDLTAKLILVPIARDIANADKGTIPPYVPPITPDDFIPKCLTVKHTTSLYYRNRQPIVDVLLSWEDPGFSHMYEIWLDVGNGWELIDRTLSNPYHLWENQNALDNEYPAGEDISVLVLPINALGYKPAFDDCTPIKFTAPIDKTAPGKPLFFAGNINKQTMYLTWYPPIEEDIGGYILKYTTDIDTPDWYRATVETQLMPYDSVSAEINARIGAYMLKTIDTTGNQSTEFALVRTTIPALEGLNVIEEVIENPAFAGSFSNTELSHGGVRLVSAGGAGSYVPVGTYEFKDVADIGYIANARLVASVDAYGAEDIYISSWPTMAAINPIAATKEGDWNVEVQVRMSSALSVIADWKPPVFAQNLADVDPLSTGLAASWSGWQRVTAGNFTGRYFQFRAVLTTSTPNVSPHVYHLKASIDMEDRVVSANNIASVVGGHRVTFPDGRFMNIPAVAVTGDHMAQGEIFVITNIAQDGFDIEFFDSSNASAVRQFDYIAKGYGMVVPKVLPAIEAGQEDDLNLLPDALNRLKKPYILQ